MFPSYSWNWSFLHFNVTFFATLSLYSSFRLPLFLLFYFFISFLFIISLLLSFFASFYLYFSLLFLSCCLTTSIIIPCFSYFILSSITIVLSWLCCYFFTLFSQFFFILQSHYLYGIFTFIPFRPYFLLFHSSFYFHSYTVYFIVYFLHLFLFIY